MATDRGYGSAGPIATFEFPASGTPTYAAVVRVVALESAFERQAKVTFSFKATELEQGRSTDRRVARRRSTCPRWSRCPSALMAGVVHRPGKTVHAIQRALFVMGAPMVLVAAVTERLPPDREYAAHIERCAGTQGEAPLNGSRAGDRCRMGL
jgi:hypothetical protein